MGSVFCRQRTTPFMPLVEPRDDAPDPRAEALEALLEHRVPDPDAAVLARIYAALVTAVPTDPLGYPGSGADHRLDRFAILCRAACDRYPAPSGAAILDALLRVTRENVNPSSNHPLARAHGCGRLLTRLLEAWQAAPEHVDATAALHALRLRDDDGWDPASLALGVRMLRRRGLVGEARSLDVAYLLEWSHPPCSQGSVFNVERTDFRGLETWLWSVGADPLAAVATIAERVDDADLVQLSRMVRPIVQRWAGSTHDVDIDQPSPVWRRSARHLARLAHVLHARVDRHADDPGFLGVFWGTTWPVLVHAPDALSSEARHAAVATATRALGKLRPLLRAAKERPGAADEFEVLAFAVLHEATQVLAYAEGMWPALKALLLAFASLSLPAVTPDLRYWDEGLAGGAPSPAPPWKHIPTRIAEVVHSFARREEATDPGLRRLREEFGTFCLERLKTRDGKIVEPRMYWRLCSVRAFRDLRVNPRGTGHHVLDWAAKNDPEEEVREAALTAYTETRRDVLLPPGNSPRRAIFAAFWWLRQAHLRDLGVDVDERGAQRTRQKETRRTKEIEEREGVEEDMI